MNRLASAIFPEDSPLLNIFDCQDTIMNVDELDIVEYKALVLWGGEDISPGIYDQLPATMYTDAPYRPSQRDHLEMALAKRAIEKGMPIIGICRGAQLMCAVSGGTLIQHVDGHGLWGSHDMETNDGQMLLTNSVHHQMMNPFEVDHELLAWTPKNLSTRYIGNDNEPVVLPEDWKEPEVVYFPKTKALCIQGHPEYSSARKEFQDYVKDIVTKYILNPKTDANHSPSGKQ